MKLSKIIIFIAMFFLTTIGALLTLTTDTQAALIATTTTKRGPLWLYTADGTKISDRALSPNTKWAVGKIINIYGARAYQVATNEYLRNADATLSDVQNPVQTPLIGTVTTHNQSGTITVDLTSNDFSTLPNLPEGSKWKIGQCLVNEFGEIYVEVAKNIYVPAVHMVFNQILPTPTYHGGILYRPFRDPNSNPSGYIDIDSWFGL